MPSPECDQKLEVPCDACVLGRFEILPMLFYAVCHERPAKCSTNWEDSVLNHWQMIPQSNELVTVTRHFKCSKISAVRPGKEIISPRVVYTICVATTLYCIKEHIKPMQFEKCKSCHDRKVAQD